MHIVFASSLEDEFQMRVECSSNMQITDSCGVLATVRQTRRARVEALVELGLERLDAMLVHGTTRVKLRADTV